jgi:hypothetical protein
MRGSGKFSARGKGPSGPLQSWVDGALVGRTQWQPSQGDKLEIALGQDD